MARCSAFIKLNPRLLVFHGFQKRSSADVGSSGLLFPVRLGNLRVLVRGLSVIFFRRLLHFTGKISWIPLE